MLKHVQKRKIHVRDREHTVDLALIAREPVLNVTHLSRAGRDEAGQDVVVRKLRTPFLRALPRRRRRHLHRWEHRQDVVPQERKSQRYKSHDNRAGGAYHGLPYPRRRHICPRVSRHHLSRGGNLINVVKPDAVQPLDYVIDVVDAAELPIERGRRQRYFVLLREPSVREFRKRRKVGRFA